VSAGRSHPRSTRSRQGPEWGIPPRRSNHGHRRGLPPVPRPTRGAPHLLPRPQFWRQRSRLCRRPRLARALRARANARKPALQDRRPARPPRREDLASPQVFEIRQKGLMVGIDLRRSPSRPYYPEEAIGARVCQIVRRHGVILRPLGSVVVLMPPLSSRSTRSTASWTPPPRPSPRPPPSPAHAPCPSFHPPTGKRSPRPSPGIFLIGTDTGVGKTTVAWPCLTLARARGLAPVPLQARGDRRRPRPRGRPPSSLRRSLQRSSARNHLPLRILPSGCACSGSGTSLHPPHSGGHPLRSTSRCRSRRLPPGRVSRRRPLPYSDNSPPRTWPPPLGLPILLVARNALGTTQPHRPRDS